MKKFLFLLSAVAIAGLSIVACQKDNPITDAVSIPASNDVSADERADCSVNFSVYAAQFGSGDYARLTYTKPDGSTATATLNSGTSFINNIAIKAGTTIDVKHRLTNNNPAAPIPANYIQTTITSGGVSKYYKYQSDRSGLVKSWVCQQTNCTLPDAGTCDCCDVLHTDTSNPDYWCN